MVVGAQSQSEAQQADKVVKNSTRQTRLLLIVAFGGLLLLLAGLGLNALSVLRTIQSRNETIRRDYISRNNVLQQLRSDIYLSGTYVRDLLLEPDPLRADRHRRELDKARSRIYSQIDAYNRILLPQEQSSFGRFHSQVDGYFSSLQPALEWNSAQRRTLGYAFMQNLLLPGRMTVVHVADQLRRVNENQLTENSRQISDLFAQFRRRLLLLLTLALSGGLLLAAISFFRIVRLERETAQRFGETLEARTALRELSSRLVEAQETERKAISRELHDEIGQSLSGLLLGIANLAASLPPELDAEAHRELQKLRRLTEKTVSTVRDLSLLLRPSMLDDLGLAPALQWQAREVSRNAHLDVRVESGELSECLSDEQNTCIYRIVQEALRNIVRHARATEVRITLIQHPSRLSLSIADNGRGFLPAKEKGLGLLGMEERIRHLGGSFFVDSLPERGTRIDVELPLAPQAILSDV